MSVGPLSSMEVLICVGPGGVGKTTLSAALALAAATRGRKSLVCTIDPAKRLAQALGLQRLGNQEARCCLQQHKLEIQAAPNPQENPCAENKGAENKDAQNKDAGGQPPMASFWAMMLDTKHAWDELISTHATPSQKTRIFNNRFYQSLSNSLAGSQEYIAIEKLWELKMRRDYGLVVLDTPPIANVLDFLDAPSHLLGFLDTEISKHLFLPMLSAGRWGFRLWKASNNLFLKTLSRFTGIQTLEQLSEFLLSMGQLYEGFRTRARQTQNLLEAPSTAFVVVTTPHPERVSEVEHFLETLEKRKLQTAAVLVNQTHLPLEPHSREALRALPKTLAKKIKLAHQTLRQQADEDAYALQKIQTLCHNIPLKIIPALDSSHSELKRLWQLSLIFQNSP
ncbi:MAG: AAA family ATPase [Cystobacterineae bacterium]|nr:AAA family ATPase [Cystobacterineae bacterium]